MYAVWALSCNTSLLHDDEDDVVHSMRNLIMGTIFSAIELATCAHSHMHILLLSLSLFSDGGLEFYHVIQMVENTL